MSQMLNTDFIPGPLTMTSCYEQTLLLIKPDAFEKGVIVEILDRVLSRFSVVAMKSMKMSEALYAEHYAHIKDLPIFEDMKTYMTSARIYALIVQGENAILGLREIIGPTFNAGQGTIRGDFGAESYRTLVHASDSQASAQIEIKRFF